MHFYSLPSFNIRHEYTNQSKPKHKRNQKFLENTFNNVFEIGASGLVVNTIYALADATQSFGESFNDTGKVLIKVPYAQYAKFTNTFYRMTSYTAAIIN